MAYKIVEAIWSNELTLGKISDAAIYLSGVSRSRTHKVQAVIRYTVQDLHSQLWLLYQFLQIEDIQFRIKEK